MNIVSSSLRTRAAACLLALLTVLATVCGSATPAGARSTSATVSVRITSITPASAAPNTPITISGEVTNTSSVPMTWVQVSFWRSQDEIADSRDLADLVASPATVPVGMRWYGEAKEASIDNITDPEAEQTFEPGDKGTFRVTGTPAQMGLTSANAVYAIGVHVQASPRGQSRHTVGRARALTVLSDAHTTANLTPVVVLTAPSRRRVDGTFADESMFTDLSGRLTDLAQAARTRNATVLIDPALLDDVNAMANGYSVAQGSTTVKGKGQDLARVWLDLVSPLLTSGRAYRLPYGNADVIGAARQGRTAALNEVRTALSPSNAAAKLPLAVLDPAAELNRPALKVLTDSMSPDLVLTCAASARRGIRDVNGVKVVGLADSPRASGQTQVLSDPQRRGLLLAQALLLTKESTPTVSLVTTADDVQATAPTNWLHLTDLSTLLSGAREGLVLSDPAAATTTLSGSWWSTVQQISRNTRDWSDLIGSSDQETSLAVAQLSARAMSGNLSNRSEWAGAMMAPATSTLAGEGLVLHSASHFVMSASTNEFPLTITNNTDRPVRVKVVVDSENPQRITIPTTQVVTVQSHETQTVQFSPKASSNGVVEMTAHLANPAGRTLNSSTTFVVKATRMDDVGWIIIVISGLVLIGATVLRIHQVTRASRRNGATDGKDRVGIVDGAQQESPARR